MTKAELKKTLNNFSKDELIEILLEASKKERGISYIERTVINKLCVKSDKINEESLLKLQECSFLNKKVLQLVEEIKGLSYDEQQEKLIELAEIKKQQQAAYKEYEKLSKKADSLLVGTE